MLETLKKCLTVKEITCAAHHPGGALWRAGGCSVGRGIGRIATQHPESHSEKAEFKTKHNSDSV